MDEHLQRAISVAVLIMEVADDLVGTTAGEDHGEDQPLDLDAISPRRRFDPAF